ncbi:DUF2975 domain-containing protein [Lentzea flaviverrucosa]|uniref:DUF2975 domain-containing protein n=1 Tax=Lentzea flaviverrucosa TaxID=200379 RepID=A0A1H9XQ91_9PSEU|nr:DUF2975 domain-containing protein [Lentzea flaviverrucosa]RDI19789.1 DUF2975 family protein [Lentzea flaviverrucosa]SES48324.1 Protein of unknown function [Lentzea flaviverrucosa]
MSRVVVFFLQALLAVAVLGGLFAQVAVIPATAANEVDLFPPYEAVRVPFVASAIIFVACLQVLAVALGGMLHRAAEGTVFESGSLTWTSVAIGAIAAGAAVLAWLFVYVTFAEIPSPADGMEVLGLWMGSAVGTIAAIGVALLVVVGRQWLGRAIAQRAELEQVV